MKLKDIIFENLNLIWYHGSKFPLDLSVNYKPIFFTKDIKYAKEYGPKIFKYEVIFRKLFDTATDKTAVEIYNKDFIPFAKIKFKNESDRFIEIKYGQYVDFLTVDYLWLFLRISKRNGKNFGYDSIVCDEGRFAISNKSKLSYIPLDVTQIKNKNHYIKYKIQ